jgi:hypothetical protein
MEMSSGSPAVRATRPELVSTVRQVQLPDAPAVVHEPPPLAAEPGTRHRQRDALVGLPTAAAARVGRREAQTLGAEPGASGATRRDPGAVPVGRLQCPGQARRQPVGARSTSSQCTGACEGPGPRKLRRATRRATL